MLSPILSLAFGHLLLPLMFLHWLWQGFGRNRLERALWSGVAGSYIAFLYLCGRWDWFGFYWRYLIVVVYLVAAAVSWRKSRGLPARPGRGWKSIFPSVASVFVLSLFLLLDVIALAGYTRPGSALRLAFPLRDGLYIVGQGGNSPMINAHNPSASQRYALDIARLNRFGTRARGLYPTEPAAYAIFGSTLYSPCDGQVTAAEDALPDLAPPDRDRDHPPGNHIVIVPSGDDAQVILAHLMHGSLLVGPGDTVRAGQPIARVGNSGNTTEPHLHIHAIRGREADPIRGGEGLPMLFDGRALVRGSLF